MFESPVAMAEMDNILDICEAQPLQNMTFLLPKENTMVVKDSEGFETEAGGGKWAEPKEANLQDSPMGEMFSNEEFPPLNKDSLRPTKSKKIPPSPIQKEKGGLRSKVSGASSSSFMVQQGNRASESHRKNKAGAPEKKKGVEQKQLIADIIKKGEKDPIFFEPEKIRKIGIVGESSGLPSIYFSGRAMHL